MVRTRFISAICTPLADDESLHRDGLAAHLDEQWREGIAGALVGGTMGLMQLLSDRAYRQLVEDSVRITAGRGEVLVGVGDTSFARTRDRIRLVEEYAIDGVVVVTPHFWKYSQADLVDYYRALADVSRKPLYLYDLPSVTGVKLDVPTVLAVASHPNVAGIKCSIGWDATRVLMDLAPARFRIIPAQAQLVDHLIRLGVRDNLDGVFALVPRWTVAIAEAAEREDWAEAARRQQRLATLLNAIVVKYPLFPACTVLLNARGIPGNFAPAPMRALTPEQRTAFLAEPVVRELLG